MNLDRQLNVFRAVGEETRLRIMALLLRGELTVSEITQILGQSQPRVSRHLKILTDAGLVDKFREGSWMFYRTAASVPEAMEAIIVALGALNRSADRVIARDGERFGQSRQTRAAQASAYFEKNAVEWDRLRSLQIEEEAVEERMLALAPTKISLFVDLGAGSGRMLTIFADSYEKGLGFDLSREMLAVARANLDQAGVSHAQVRHGDLFALPLENGAADVVCIHQVLHYLADPAAAVAEAARLLKPGGKLLLSDFAPHDLEFLREAHAHRRLGFSDDEVGDWCAAAGLKLVTTETLAPRRISAQALTVKIWLAEARAQVRSLKKRVA
ncbi:MAG: metalloregulator ArsR/SmtB family transcription factor [Parvularculaceae bacterium]|nr:metalloregulator ArsR/SmtB family transcription factor [Parvularculaceae bacterium]